MSEGSQPHTAEKIGHHGPENRPEGHLEHRPKHHEAAPRHEHAEALDKIKLEIEQQAASSEGIKEGLNAETRAPAQPRLLNRELKQKALHDTLSQTRRHLKAPERSLSKFIHRPAVEAVSQLAANTVARPSGLLAAGLTALFGGLGLLYLSRHYGYEYRFSAYALLMGGGFAIGIIAELLLKLWRRR